MQPVVLMGRGHSGTRVLSWICTYLGVQLGTSDQQATGDAEDKRFTERIKAIAERNLQVTTPETVRPGDLADFQSAVAAYYRRLGSPAGQWGWKFPETYLIGPCVARTFPQARYIHLVRDGRDLAFKRHLTDDPRRKLGRLILAKQQALELPHHLQAALSWAYQVDNFDRFRCCVPAAQIFEVRFEQLCSRPDDVVPTLCQFLGLPMTARCREYVAQQIDSDKVAQYRREDPALVKEVQERVGPTLRRYGYDAETVPASVTGPGGSVS